MIFRAPAGADAGNPFLVIESLQRTYAMMTRNWNNYNTTCLCYKSKNMKRILFIDTRNAMRSQIAEAWFNHLAGDCGEGFSCGTMPANAIAPRAIQVLREVGLEPEHVPQSIQQQLLANADMVVLMGQDVRPHAFKPNYIWDFQDWPEASVETVRELRDQIRSRVAKLIAEIRFQDRDVFRTVGEWQMMMLCLQHG